MRRLRARARGVVLVGSQPDQAVAVQAMLDVPRTACVRKRSGPAAVCGYPHYAALNNESLRM